VSLPLSQTPPNEKPSPLGALAFPLRWSFCVTVRLRAQEERKQTGEPRIKTHARDVSLRRNIHANVLDSGRRGAEVRWPCRCTVYIHGGGWVVSGVVMSLAAASADARTVFGQKGILLRGDQYRLLLREVRLPAPRCYDALPSTSLAITFLRSKARGGPL